MDAQFNILADIAQNGPIGAACAAIITACGYYVRGQREHSRVRKLEERRLAQRIAVGEVVTSAAKCEGIEFPEMKALHDATMAAISKSRHETVAGQARSMQISTENSQGLARVGDAVNRMCEEMAKLAQGQHETWKTVTEIAANQRATKGRAG